MGAPRSSESLSVWGYRPGTRGPGRWTWDRTGRGVAVTGCREGAAPVSEPCPHHPGRRWTVPPALKRSLGSSAWFLWLPWGHGASELGGLP